MSDKSIVEKIKSAGLRATKPRVAVLALLEKSKLPISAQSIARELRKSVDQVSVYRIVEAFEKAGLTRRVDLRQGHSLYEMADMEHDHHHHAVCTHCGLVEDVHLEESDMNTRALKRSGFATISSHSLEFFGECKRCAN